MNEAAPASRTQYNRLIVRQSVADPGFPRWERDLVLESPIPEMWAKTYFYRPQQ